MKQAEIQVERLYVIYYDGKPLHMVKDRYGEFRPPKRVYWNMKAANAGVRGLAKEFDRSKVTIVPYAPETPVS